MAKKRTAKKPSPKQAPARAAVPRDLSDKDVTTLKLIQQTALRTKASITKRVLPELRFPIRNLSNVKYSKKTGYLEIGTGRKARALSVNTVKNFAQTLRLMSFTKELVENDKRVTKREAYYISKNWGEAKFNNQPESDTVLDDIEALASLDGLSREHLRFRPEEKSGNVAGKLTVIDADRRTGEELRIDCTRFGSGSYSIPSSVEHLKFETKAKFILAVETGGTFDRLNEDGYWQDSNCILIGMGGVPSRAQRRFIRRLSDEKKIPVYAFVDCDPYGFGNIYRTLKVGSGNAAHINRLFSVPKAKFIGLTPMDIQEHGLMEATHKLLPVDIKRAKDALKNDPFFQAHKEWKKAIELMLKMGVRAEQQALSFHGLNYVSETYLPQKLADPKSLLP